MKNLIIIILFALVLYHSDRAERNEKYAVAAIKLADFYKTMAEKNN